MLLYIRCVIVALRWRLLCENSKRKWQILYSSLFFGSRLVVLLLLCVESHVVSAANFIFILG